MILIINQLSLISCNEITFFNWLGCTSYNILVLRVYVNGDHMPSRIPQYGHLNEAFVHIGPVQKFHKLVFYS